MTTTNTTMKESTAIAIAEKSKNALKKSSAKKSTKAKKPAEKIEKVETEIVEANQTKFPQFLEDSKAVEIIDTAKLSNQLDKATEQIRKEIGNVAKSFCRIGFQLWTAKENKLYLGQDFKNVYEYAENKLGFRKASTANYIAICERFSVHKDGKPTAQLLTDFASFSYTQLSLMLSLPDEKIPEIKPETPCKQIRELKNAAKDETSDASEPEPEIVVTVAKTWMPVFTNKLTDKNIDIVIKLLRENIGQDIKISIWDI